MKNLIDKAAVVIKADGELKSYEKVTIMDVYPDDNIKVMDAAMDVHMTKLSNLKVIQN